MTDISNGEIPKSPSEVRADPELSIEPIVTAGDFDETSGPTSFTKPTLLVVLQGGCSGERPPKTRAGYYFRGSRAALDLPWIRRS